MIRKALIPSIIVAGVIINSCKKIDPDCSTCPCPACPRITEVLPNHGRPGDTLILKGINFNVDPYLNLITFNDTLVQEILDGTTTELKVIVPEGTTTGSVKIKINDDKALSSDEIPDFVEPVFTIDHFVELVAGTPGVQGSDDGGIFSSKFNEITKISINDDLNSIAVLENYAKQIREVNNGNVSTLFSGASTVTQFSDINYSQNRLFFSDYGTNTRIRYLLNGNDVTYLTSGSISFLKAFAINKVEDKLIYMKVSGQKNYICERSITTLLEDTLKSFISGTVWDIEIKNNTVYIGIGSNIVRFSSVNGYIPDTLYTDPTWAPYGIAVSNTGDVYFSKALQHQIFKVKSRNQAEVIAGTVASGVNLVETFPLQSNFNTIYDIDFDKNNNLYIVDAGNFCIRKLKID